MVEAFLLHRGDIEVVSRPDDICRGHPRTLGLRLKGGRTRRVILCVGFCFESSVSLLVCFVTIPIQICHAFTFFLLLLRLAFGRTFIEPFFSAIEGGLYYIDLLQIFDIFLDS